MQWNFNLSPAQEEEEEDQTPKLIKQLILELDTLDMEQLQDFVCGAMCVNCRRRRESLQHFCAQTAKFACV
jgi:hypothetical protein